MLERRDQMTTINNAAPSSYHSSFQPTGQAANSQEKNGDDSNKIVIEVTPGEDNVDSGDRSQNTAVISITTPNREKEVEVSREQVFNAVGFQVKKNAVGNVVNGSGNGKNPIASAIIADNLDEASLEELAYLKLKTNQIETYARASGNNDTSSDSGNTTNAQDYKDSPAYQMSTAKNAYVKQKYIFSTLDRLDITDKI